MAISLGTVAPALIAALLVSACAYTQPASPQQDTLAKEFVTHPNASSIYVYRSQFNHHDTDTVLYLDGRVIGATQPGGYFRIDTTPGLHMLHGTGNDVGEFRLNTRGGQLYFVAVEVNGGHSSFRVVPEDTGRNLVRTCCVLLEGALIPRGAVLR